MKKQKTNDTKILYTAYLITEGFNRKELLKLICILIEYYNNTKRKNKAENIKNVKERCANVGE